MLLHLIALVRDISISKVRYRKLPVVEIVIKVRNSVSSFWNCSISTTFLVKLFLYPFQYQILARFQQAKITLLNQLELSKLLTQQTQVDEPCLLPASYSSLFQQNVASSSLLTASCFDLCTYYHRSLGYNLLYQFYIAR